MITIEDYEPIKPFKQMDKTELVEYIKKCILLDSQRGGKRSRTRKRLKTKRRKTKKKLENNY